ncbi:flagellar basal-body MS-ring/collar protein FliF [Xanthomonas cucurbitae]|uniref:Flagellar M-ring protein n=1 Tax=Xanthomonas cucurbitae TaxID=56453 RepID=A0ABY7YD61_9XANT|nr:flagellar basal-body MS-ring/collar protein FliF [Xanthomonas cucurbitae]WDM67825.1 flagellar M-ring protein FliF [Xanthomonas cucurbitae]WDM71699.1 flagellar M-ring protein FliF [Xanthomonas cucurbitae]
MKTTYSSLQPAKKIGLVVAAIVLALLTAVAFWWVLVPGQALLFGDLKEADAAEVSAALDEWKVPHGYTADGSGILVDKAQVHPLRMRLVSAGIPKGGHVGFELFDTNEFGVTEFAQRINYQRALQGEIERTIATLPGVEAVRVHLSIRRPGVFLAEDSQSKASVSVSLAPGTVLTAKQVSGIRDLVAAAVDGLSAEAVVVVGPTGLQLAGGTGDVSAGQGDLARQLASDYEREIRKILQAQPSTVTASISVNVAMNFDKVHTTSERPLVAPGQEHGIVIRRNASADRATDGAAGALLNEQVEYAHGTERQEITRAVGRVERVSVAIAVPEPLSGVEQQRLQRLVMAAIGGDASRGDVVEIGVGAAMAVARAAGKPPAPPARHVAPGNVAASAILQPKNGMGLWLVVASITSVLMGVVIGRSLTRSRRKRLTSPQSELAAEQIRTWLLGTTHERL